MTYDEFIDHKTKKASAVGFEPYPIESPLFDWQKHVVNWGIRQGRCAFFEECGLGKGPQQMEWARQVVKHTQGPVLILAPLMVSYQFVDESKKFGIEVNLAASQADVKKDAVYVTNYDKLEHFDPVKFSGVSLDESSRLKSFTGKERKQLTDAFRHTPYKLCNTATPSPNDYTELGQHAEFLGICTPMQMLATFFINDTFNTGDWRLKGHAENEFWKWLASWAACISRPSDIGFKDDGYILPRLNMIDEIVEVDERASNGEDLFKHVTLSATTMHQEMRETSTARAKRVAELVASNNEQWIVWCNTNDEADKLAELMPDAVEIRGSDTAHKKEQAIKGFIAKTTRTIISKSSIFGYGLNLQQCHNNAFVGLSYSFEDFYQALRRTYRFGQTQEVNAHVIQARTEGAITQTIKRKMEQHENMQEKMKIAAKAFTENQSAFVQVRENTTMRIPNWIDSYAKGCINNEWEKLKVNAPFAIPESLVGQQKQENISAIHTANPNGKNSGVQSRLIGSGINTNQKNLTALKLPNWLTEIRNQCGTG